MRFILCITMVLLLSGCAVNAVYNPVQSAIQQTLLLNETALANIKEGMNIDAVHQVMGQEIIIGYTSNTPSNNNSKLAPDQSAALPPAYKPLTIPNPYKGEEISVSQSMYVVEYYVVRVHQPDGIISNDELMPLVFSGGKLVGRGWPFLEALRLKK